MPQTCMRDSGRDTPFVPLQRRINVLQGELTPKPERRGIKLPPPVLHEAPFLMIDPNTPFPT